jgi:hypothetical protein
MTQQGYQTSMWPIGWTTEQITCMNTASTSRPLSTRAQQRLALASHLERLRRAQQRNEFLDLRLAELLVAALDRLWPADATTDSASDPWLQMAVAYLVHTDDAKDDEIAIDGLDDDAAVIIALSLALGRPDVAKPIREHIDR